MAKKGPRMLRLRLLPRPEYRRLWLAQTISNAGTGVSSVAIPLTAVLVLAATPTDTGILGAARTAPAESVRRHLGRSPAAPADSYRRRRRARAASRGHPP